MNDDWREQPPETLEPPDWVRGWVIARFRDRDMRLWPEQEPGYRGTDSDWEAALEAHGLMPAERRGRYVAEGLSVPFAGLAELMSGVAKVTETPTQDADGWETEPAQPVGSRA